MGWFYPLSGCGFANRICGNRFSFCLHHDYLSYCVIADLLATAIGRLGSSVPYSAVSSPGLYQYYCTGVLYSTCHTIWKVGPFPDIAPNRRIVCRTFPIL